MSEPRLNPWIRLYRSALHNPKIVTLNDRQHRAWVNCLLIADDTGALPRVRDIACHARMSLQDTEHLLTDLLEAKLIDAEGFGEARRLRLHDWPTHQYVSDNSTARVRKFRQRKQGGVTAARAGRSLSRASDAHPHPREAIQPGRAENGPASSPPPGHHAGAGEERHEPDCAPSETAMKRFSNGSVTPPESDSESDTDTENLVLHFHREAARAAPAPGSGEQSFDLGLGQGKGDRRSAGEGLSGETLHRQAEKLGLPVAELIDTVKRNRPRSPSAYFRTLAVNRLKADLPGIKEPVLHAALQGDDKATAAVWQAQLAAEVP